MDATFQALAPPLGFVDVMTSPWTSTATQLLGLGHETEVKLPPRSGMKKDFHPAATLVVGCAVPAGELCRASDAPTTARQITSAVAVNTATAFHGAEVERSCRACVGIRCASESSAWVCARARSSNMAGVIGDR